MPKPLSLYAKANSPSFFAELTEFATELSEISLPKPYETVLHPFPNTPANAAGHFWTMGARVLSSIGLVTGFGTFTRRAQCPCAG